MTTGAAAREIVSSSIAREISISVRLVSTRAESGASPAASTP